MSELGVSELIELASKAVAKATERGAGIAEAIAKKSVDLSTKVRMGEPELVEEAGSLGIGLRVIHEGRSSTTYTSDPSDRGLDALVEDALELALLSEPDEHAGPPDPSLLAKTIPDLDLYDPAVARLDGATTKALALQAEQAARDFDPRITNSEGASASRTYSATALVTSGGFSGGFRGSYASINVNPLADDEGGKKRTGYDWDARRYFHMLRSAEDIGREAARRTVEKLGARKVSTAELPVVFHPDAGRSLLSLLFSCIAGGAIYQRRSYLVDREGDHIASELVNIVDDPLIPRGPGSRPFDGEGLRSRKNVVVEGGVLATYLLDTYSARKLGRESTGSAARGVGGRPSAAPTNFHLLAGERAEDDIVREVDRGLYVTSMMGFGFNPVTGDFSRGAEGFWIEKGEKTYPVSEITISLNFEELWKGIDAVGSDLDPKTTLATPTFRVRRMTVAGT